MSTDVDPLDELFSDQGARCSKAGGKFAPKVKPRPKKGTLIKLPSSQPVPNIKSTGNNLDSVSETHSLNNSSLACDSSEFLAGQSVVDNVGLQTDIVLPDINGKPEGEKASRKIDVDHLDKIFPEHVARSDRDGGNFPSKSGPHLQKDTSEKLASSESVLTKTVAEINTDNPADNKLDPIIGEHYFDNPALVNNNSTEQHLIEEASANNLSHHTDVVLPVINAGEEVSRNSYDPLDEIFPDHVAKGARAGNKILPKSKLLPIKGSSIKKPSLPPAQNTSVAGNELKKTSESKLDNNLDLHFGGVLPDINEKATQVNAETIVGLESFDNSYFQATSSGVDVASGPLDKVESSLQPEAPPTIEGSAVGVSNGFPLPICPVNDATIDAFSQDQSVDTTSDGSAVGFHFTDGVLEVEEVETGPSIEGSECIFDTTTQSGQRTLKLRPKPKFQANAKKNAASTSFSDVSEDVPFSDYNELRSQVLPSEGITGPFEASFPEASYSGDQVGLSGSLEKSADLREMNSFMAFDDSPEHQEASISGQGDVPGISNQKLIGRRRKYSLVDEDGDYVPDIENLATDPSCSPIEDVDHNDGVNEVDVEPQTEKKPKRSRKSTLQKEQPIRKCKNGNEAGDPVTRNPRKKFSHSTRRNKRQVDKVLLETPEDEIDMRKLRIRDIILLAEHRERITSKEGKTTETLPANQSAGTSFTGNKDSYFGDEDFASGGQFSNDQTTNSNYFNYHTYMKRTPRVRWNKQDTELFYEGVRQFGSDISMIQQLFPDKTHAQVKLKYKKEERQQPLRLHEALTNRSGDHSHFQRVIEHLKQLGGAENQNSFEDNSIDSTGNGEEVNPETNEVENHEEVDIREDDEVEPGIGEAQSPHKSAYDSEDDSSMWCQYKSDL